MLTPITNWNFKMKVIQDLGMQKPTENYHKKVRMALFECTHCRMQFSAVVCKKAENQLYCKQCMHLPLLKGNREHPLYRIWADTKAKLVATNKHRVAYLDKGITMCDEWKDSFDTFYEWAMTSGYAPGLTIDRKDNNGNYEPNNCRWVTWSVQIANQRCLKSTNTTGYRGVTQISATKYTTHIRFENRRYVLGVFTDVLVAAKAYDSFVALMQWPHTTNNVLVGSELVFPTNKTTVKFLSSIGIHESDFMSKEP